MIEVKEKKYNSNEYQFTKYEHFWIVNQKYSEVLLNDINFSVAPLDEETKNIVYYNGIAISYIGSYNYPIDDVQDIMYNQNKGSKCISIGIFVYDNIKRIHYKVPCNDPDGNIIFEAVPNTKIILIDNTETLLLLCTNNKFTPAELPQNIDLSKVPVEIIDNGKKIIPVYLNCFPIVTYLGTLPAKQIDPERDGALKVGIYFINNKTNEN